MQPQGNVMKKSLLLLVLASAAAISGCVTSAGYRGHGGYSSSDYYRYSRSYPYGYHGSGGYSYGYDRYGYDGYGRSYGYPYGYAPYYNNNRYYYYYPTPQRPPANNPPPQPDRNRFNPASVQYDPNAQPVTGNAQPIMERQRRIRPMREEMRMPVRSGASGMTRSQAAPTGAGDPASVLESVR